MLCSLALRRSRERGDQPYSLRVTGRTSLRPSGTGGADLIEPLNADAVRDTLRSLRMPPEVLAAAEAVMKDPQHAQRFISVVEAVQIPYEVLEQARIDLFD
ncbi:hypothetical protein SAMN05443244_1025 [Terriglobus roseus]|uniref:Uncharacterized protein n=1 Tax=Terriglobus roseus TaxID=392734 RepID=A0A1H4K722_9BACT|nr:hypothetical protein SAMN05443244_1025 [Terriglobus roseus]